MVISFPSATVVTAMPGLLQAGASPVEGSADNWEAGEFHVARARPSRRSCRTVVALGRGGVAIVGLVVVGAVTVGGASVGGAHLSTSSLHRSAGAPVGPPLRVTTTTTTTAASLSPLRSRIVALAESQVGYETDPPGTYCNKFSAYWYSGQHTCGNGDLAEEWCADFAAWVWQKAGATVVYRFAHGDLNSSAASFYEWGEAHGTWHPLGSGYVAQPGDVAVYGLDTKNLVADHVAVVIADTPGQAGPAVVNGDGDLNAFSAVDFRHDEYWADIASPGAPLSGYVSPSRPAEVLASPRGLISSPTPGAGVRGLEHGGAGRSGPQVANRSMSQDRQVETRGRIKR